MQRVKYVTMYKNTVDCEIDTSVMRPILRITYGGREP